MKNWDNVVLVPEFDEQGVACYRLEGGDYENEYYVISEAESRKLLNTPEIVGYEVYNCLVSSTSQMLYYLKGIARPHELPGERTSETYPHPYSSKA